MTDVLCIIGTRPELVKVAPVVEALRARDIATDMLTTGQHTSLLDPALMARLGPVSSLGVASTGNVLKFLTKARAALRLVLQAATPRCVLVQGDTMSTFVGALVACDLGISVAHVEAGVRSGSLSEPWPEELIRVTVDGLATWHYAPTEHSLRNLQRECHDGIVTGNTSVDALRAYVGVYPRAEAGATILVTLHRRELRTSAHALATLQALCDTVSASHINAIWPVHPAMTALAARLNAPANFSPRPPMSHRTILHALSEARGLLTDSGGLVEEAATLGVPTAILRGANDRPEAVEAGIARVFAPTPDGARNAIETLAAREIPRRATNAYGDGKAAQRIAAHLAAELTKR